MFPTSPLPTNRPMNPRSAKAKGKLLERFIEGEFRQSGIDKGAYRTPGSGSGLNKGDVVSPKLNWSIEAKNTKNCPISSWGQARREAVGDYAVPVLFWHPPQKPMESSVVMIRWADLKEILKLAFRSKELK